MPDLEKRAWFEIAVVLSAIATWLVLFFAFHSLGGSMAAFALLAATAWSGPQEGRDPDERDRAIAEWGLMLGLRTLFVVATATPVVLGLFWGWERTLTVASLAQTVYLGWCLVLVVRSGAIIVRYRSVPYA